MIQAIETKYKGYNFRSRLEARWAVFFDALGIKWEYEKEGYDLGKLGWYLPDFWLPDFSFYVEIKPLTFVREPWSKYDKFCELHRIILVEGAPWEYETYDFTDSYGTECADLGRWGQCVVCGAPRFGFRSNGEFQGSHCNCRPFSESFEYDLDFAVNPARSARFEHGANPQPRRPA
jgi:hypothetical protein